AMPRGYGLGLVGVGCWFVGGPFDTVWHSVFGFEASVEALMSPAHAILALGFGLMASGPLRAGLQRPSDRWSDKLAITLSMTFVVGCVFDRGPYPHAAVLAMILGAALADVLRAWLSPSMSRPRAFRVFAVAQPALLYAAYFAALGATSGLGWSTHLWLGVVIFA